jgi:hypothetical protein
MGQAARWEYLVIVPDKYWTSNHNIKWIVKESKCQKKSEK